MIIRPYGSEKLHKPGFETFYEAIKLDGSGFLCKIKDHELSIDRPGYI